MLRGVDPLLFQPLALAHRRQAGGVLVLLVVAALLIEREEAGEADDLAGGAEVELSRAGFGENVHRGALDLGALHLAGDGSGPDELVELGLLGLEMAGDVARPPRHLGRADRLVRLLRVLGLGGVFARRARHVGVAEILADHPARRRHRLGGEVDAIGAHVGDEPDRAVADVHALVKALGDLHGAGGRKAELARGLLLQGGGGEGRIGVAPDRLRFDRGDREARSLERRLEGSRLLARADVEPRDLLAVRADEAGRERRAGLGLEMGDDRPVLARDELLDLDFAVAHESQRHRLHAAGRARAGELAPQHRREGEADQIVERPARPIGVDQRLVDLARMAHRLLHGVLGDRVEHHPVDALVLEQLLVPEDLVDVPRDRLALAVGVGRQNDPIGAPDRDANVAEPLGRLGVDLPAHGEIVVRIDRAVLGGEIADVAIGGVDPVVLAQVFVDGLRLGGRFDDHDFHTASFGGPFEASLVSVRARDMERRGPRVKSGRERRSAS